jgi:hypothetical protein
MVSYDEKLERSDHRCRLASTGLTGPRPRKPHEHRENHGNGRVEEVTLSILMTRRNALAFGVAAGSAAILSRPIRAQELPTIPDAILDRLVHNAYRIDLKGESLRKQKQSAPGQPAT